MGGGRASVVEVVVVETVVVVFAVVTVVAVPVVLDGPAAPASAGTVQFLPCHDHPSPLHWQ